MAGAEAVAGATVRKVTTPVFLEHVTGTPFPPFLSGQSSDSELLKSSSQFVSSEAASLWRELLILRDLQLL